MIASDVSVDVRAGRVESVRELDATQLERLAVSQGVYTSGPFLAFMEGMRGDKGVHYQVAYRPSGQLIAVLPVYPGRPSAGGYWDPTGRFLTRAGLDLDPALWDPAVTVGARTGSGHGFLICPELSDEEGGAVLRRLLRSACVPPASLSALYLSDPGRRQFLAASVPAADLFVAGATSVVDVAWGSHEDYVSALPRPGNVRREMRTFRDSGCTVRGDRLSRWAAQIAPMFAALDAKYGGGSSAEAELEEMSAIVDHLDSLTHVLVVERDGAVVGAVLLFLWQSTIYVRQAGFDYNQTGRAFEYFNLIYYEVVRLALETGATRIDYGMATYRAKLARGAHVEPLWGYVVDLAGDSITQYPEFRRWDRVRQRAVNDGTATALEQVDLP